jgi:hypothetical protein
VRDDSRVEFVLFHGVRMLRLGYLQDFDHDKAIPLVSTDALKHHEPIDEKMPLKVVEI